MNDEAPFPPRSPADVAAYPDHELVLGFIEFRPEDPDPGDNRSPAYRWGWMNAKRDHAKVDDGYDAFRAWVISDFRQRGIPLCR